MSDKYWWAIPCMIAFVFLSTMGLISGYDRGIDEMQQQAVVTGHAEWVADKNGKPRFKWKESK
jgi:hypothetical protein